MNRTLCAAAVLVASTVSAHGAAASVPYHVGGDFLPQTPGVTGGAAGAFFNPAAWATVHDAETAFWFKDRREEGGPDGWGISHGGPVGFSVITRDFGDESGDFRIHDYQLGLALGNRRSHVGAAWRWTTGDRENEEFDDGLALGWVVRPDPRFSFGASGFLAGVTDPAEGVFDAGFRPFGRPWLTLFGDYSVVEGRDVEDGLWGVGAEVRPLRGLHVGAKVRDEGSEYRWQLDVGVSFDALAFHVQPGYGEDGDHRDTHYLVRLRPPHHGVPILREIETRKGPDRYVPLRLDRRVLTYQRDRYFDDTRVAWIDLARHLDEVGEDPRVRGLVISLSGFRSRPSLTWELRRKLETLRLAGKEIVIYADDLGMSGYYLASMADELVLDPHGSLVLPGLALERTYMAGLLGKLGLGAEEWRHFSHKTAFQTYTRETMSEADREQTARMADVIYETWRDGVCRGRNLTYEAYDALVDDDVYLTPEMALDRGLADRLGRWEDIEAWIREERGAKLSGFVRDASRRIVPDERWGRPPEIEIVYAVGPCRMDAGIRGRATGRELQRIARDDAVAAVVLRADSPGGYPLASDLVAGGTRAVREKGTPVVVSQGDVAASGGYWISMDGSRILTTPFTVTGSIGVIAGWVWDDGFSEKTGLTADGVQRGRHADLFTGIRIPLLGERLPTRNLTEDEKGMVQDRILRLYDTFVAGVAEGRELSEETVREVGEGRVWMGGDAIGKGLCDDFGGLDEAVAEAKALAGLRPDDEVILTEFPERRLVSWPRLGPRLPGLDDLVFGREAPYARVLSGTSPGPATDDYAVEYLRLILSARGAPLGLLPPEALPPGWNPD